MRRISVISFAAMFFVVFTVVLAGCVAQTSTSQAQISTFTQITAASTPNPSDTPASNQGLFTNLSKIKSTVVYAVKSSAGLITFTNGGGPDVADLVSIDIAIDSDVPTIKLGPNEGSKITFQGNSGKENHIIVIGTFKDGYRQYILNTYV